LSQFTRVTDGWTDGQTHRRTHRPTDEQTDRILIARPRLHSMQRGKNEKLAEGGRGAGTMTDFSNFGSP